MNMIFIIWA